jgi:hypothetical protein
MKENKVMTQFEENNPAQLREFLTKLNELIDDYHHDIYLIDGIFKGFKTIEVAISDELNKGK